MEITYVLQTTIMSVREVEGACRQARSDAGDQLHDYDFLEPRSGE